MAFSKNRCWPSWRIFRRHFFCLGLARNYRPGWFTLLFGLSFLLFATRASFAQSPPPDYSGDLIGSWSFNDTSNWTDDFGGLPTTWTNLAVARGDGPAVLLDNTNGSWLAYPVQALDGSWTNLSLSQGTLMGWVYLTNAASSNGWSLDAGQWGTFAEVGAWTGDASYGWWSLWTDGTNINFSSQAGGVQSNYLSAPLGWNAASNSWAHFALTWTSNATLLYWNGALVTNGPGIGPLPDLTVVSNWFYLGSSGPSNQLHAAFDDIWSYNYPLDSKTVAGYYDVYSMVFNGTPPLSPLPALSPAPSSPATTNLITGGGNLTAIYTNSTCLSNASVWLTNVTAAIAGNGTVNVTFAIAGGTDGALYDVFATSFLTSPATNGAWNWMGQGNHCVTYVLTNMPASAAFLILGTSRDSDADGLTDAFELLVSKSDPNNPDTNGDGIPDGLSVIYGIDPVARPQFGVWLATPSGFSGLP